MTKTDKGIELLKENPFMGVKKAAGRAGIKRDTLKTALSQQGLKMSDLKQQYVEQLEAAAPDDFEFKPQLKADDNMEIVKKLEKVGYEKVKRTARDNYYRKMYDAEEYYQDPEVIPEGTKSVLSRVYPEREYADYINFISENPSKQEIANANKIHEDDYRALVNNLHEDIAVLIDDPNHTIIADEFEQIINLIQEYDEVRHIFDDFNSLVRYTEQQELGKKYEYYATSWTEFREELHNWIKENFAELFDYLSFDNKQKLDEYVIDDVFSEKELTEILQDNFSEYWDKVAK